MNYYNHRSPQVFPPKAPAKPYVLPEGKTLHDVMMEDAKLVAEANGMKVGQKPGVAGEAGRGYPLTESTTKKRADAVIAAMQPGQWVSVAEISDKVGMSANCGRRSMQQLHAAGKLQRRKETTGQWLVYRYALPATRGSR